MSLTDDKSLNNVTEQKMFSLIKSRRDDYENPHEIQETQQKQGISRGV